MTTTIFKSNGIISLGSISSEEDLEPKASISINPPPGDLRCQCCGRHISELEPFGKAGDPLVGDFEGELLVIKWRRHAPRPDEEVCKIMEEFDPEKAKEMLIEKYGEEEAEHLEIWYSGYDLMGSSWECRDCIILDEDEYFRKLRENYGKGKSLEEDCSRSDNSQD